MKNENSNSLPIAFVLVLILLITGSVVFFTRGTGPLNQDQNVGTDIGATRFTKANVSSSVAVQTTSTLVLATTSAAQYREITNLGTSTIFCNLDNGKAASYQSGITIFASSTYTLAPDKENMYVGAIRCIAPGGVSTSTVFERI